jgi:xylose isomerase
MRTYKICKEKASCFTADSEIQALLNELHGGDQSCGGFLNGYSGEAARMQKETAFDIESLPRRGFHDEKLDQLTVEHILGVRYVGSE